MQPSGSRTDPASAPLQDEGGSKSEPVARAAQPGSPAPTTGDTLPDCQACGVCCFGDEMWIHLFLDDDKRLGEANVEQLTVLTHHGRGYVARSMRMTDGHCVAFRQDLGDGRCGCSIYGIRPQICRDFEAGSLDCRAARRRHGLE